MPRAAPAWAWQDSLGSLSQRSLSHAWEEPRVERNVSASSRLQQKALLLKNRKDDLAPFSQGGIKNSEEHWECTWAGAGVEFEPRTLSL